MWRNTCLSCKTPFCYNAIFIPKVSLPYSSSFGSCEGHPIRNVYGQTCLSYWNYFHYQECLNLREVYVVHPNKSVSWSWLFKQEMLVLIFEGPNLHQRLVVWQIGEKTYLTYSVFEFFFFRNFKVVRIYVFEIFSRF